MVHLDASPEFQALDWRLACTSHAPLEDSRLIVATIQLTYDLTRAACRCTNCGSRPVKLPCHFAFRLTHTQTFAKSTRSATQRHRVCRPVALMFRCFQNVISTASDRRVFRTRTKCATFASSLVAADTAKESSSGILCHSTLRSCQPPAGRITEKWNRESVAVRKETNYWPKLQDSEVSWHCC